MKVRIFRPSRNVMQSGRANTAKWVLEYELLTKREPEPLMGWTRSEDTLNQVRLKFATAEDAVAYAEAKGWEYTILTPQERRVVPRNYVDNFKYIPHEDSAAR